MSILKLFDPAARARSVNPLTAPRNSRNRPAAIEPLCPYCRAAVPKIPKYKAICDRCGQTYFVRTRPGESHPALVTLRQAAALDENRAVQPAWTRSAVAAEPVSDRPINWVWAYSTAEKQWHQLRRSLTLHERDGNWLLYRNARFEMAEIRRRQGRHKEAVDVYLEVWYLDLNGPHDCWGVIGARRVYESSPFQPNDGMTTPVVARWVNRLGIRMDVEKAYIERLFGEIALKAYRTLNLPVTPREAWAVIQRELVI